MDFSGLPARLADVRETIRRRQEVGGWHHSVRIVAVTKTHGPEVARAAFSAGLRDVGENRIQEALPKQDALSDLPLEWHLVGTLQRNKARQAAGRFALIHSVDRAELAAELDRRVPDGSRQPILVQVNCSGESQKGGVDPESLSSLLDQLQSLERLEVLGLMTMSALGGGEKDQRHAFRQLRELRDKAESEGYRLSELSMGMSDDFPVAVEEGATMVRLGTILFGERTA